MRCHWYRVATFEADITIPIGHACMGGGVADAKRDRRSAVRQGVRAPGAGEADRGRRPGLVPVQQRFLRPLARRAGRRPPARRAARVMLATVHQHDAPICDLTAQKLLDEHGPEGLQLRSRVPRAGRPADRRGPARRRSRRPRRVTHFGIGQAKVEKVASNRRVVDARGPRSTWDRGSASGDIYGAPEGEIDPWLKTISLWDGDRPVLAWSCYAVHPMSYYGRGGVSADFPGIARARRQQDDPSVFQIYFTGCAGDTTAGKYNTGDPKNRPGAGRPAVPGDARRLEGDRSDSRSDQVDFRVAEMPLPAREHRRLHHRGHAEDAGRPEGHALAADLRRAGPELAAAGRCRPAGRRAVPGPRRRSAQFLDHARRRASSATSLRPSDCGPTRS